MDCGECTLCCELFPVKWLSKPANEPCIHCDNGCAIHETKPKECSGFDCAFVQGVDVAVKFRPDNCGVIFERLTDKIFYGTVNHNKEISEDGKTQARGFVRQGFSVVLGSLRKKKPFFMINEKHDEIDIGVEFMKQIEMRYGNIRN